MENTSQSMLDVLRRKMLHGKSDQSDPETIRSALFGGRAVHVQQLAHPSALPNDADPHRLFQLLRKKKRPSLSVMPTHQPNSGPSRPRVAEAGGDVQRPLSRISAHSARPASPATRQNTAISREVHSATLTRDGRPCTRQKHPKKALDLFERASKPEADLFPKPTSRRNSANQPEVDFRCLFFNSDDELDNNNEAFPGPKSAKIPLIETDWFTTDSWEYLPTTEPDHPRDEDAEVQDDSQYAESLYEMLIAQKRRPLEKTQKE